MAQGIMLFPNIPRDFMAKKVLVGSILVFSFIFGLRLAAINNIDLGSARVILEIVTIPFVLAQFFLFGAAIYLMVNGDKSSKNWISAVLMGISIVFTGYSFM